MLSKRIMPLVCSAVFAMSAVAGCANGGNGSISSDGGKKDMTHIVANSDNVKLVGRTELIGDTLWSALSGTGAEFEFTGKKLTVTFAGDNSAIEGNEDNAARVAVYVGGERVVDAQIDAKEKSFTVIDSEETTTADVSIIKLSECAMSTVGIKPLDVGEDGSIKPVKAKKRRIEFIGDSITCGYGVDDEDENHHFKTATEDCTRAYAYKTAQMLDSEYSLFSTSGYGIISGYTSNDKKIPQQTIPQYYGSLGFSYQGFEGDKLPQNEEWDFSQFVPDVVVINLGTNDDSYCKGQSERMDEYTEEYVKFIKTVREKNPDAYIICSVGIMGQRIFQALDMAVYLYKKETGDDKIVSFMFDAQLPEDGLVADYHPTAVTHDKAAAALADEIKKVTGWK